MTQEPFSDSVPPPPPELPPPAPLPPPRARRGRALLYGIVLAALVVGVAGTAPYWVPLLPWRADDRVAADEARIAQLEREARLPPAEPTSLPALQARVAALEARGPAAPDAAGLDDAAQKAAADASQKLAARIDALETRVTGVSDAAAHGDPLDVAKLAAVADLRAALAGSGPFADELDALRALGGDLGALKPLDASAKTGIPDRALLAERFRAVTAPAILAAANAAPAPEPDDFSERVLARLEGLVTIRRVDGTQSPSAPAVRDAEAALDSGDLDGALRALKPLGGKDAEAARPFVAEVEARLGAERAVADLARQIAARLASGGQR
jgi:hypothetical protein